MEQEEIEKTFGYLNKGNPYFKGNDKIVFEELCKLNANSGKESIWILIRKVKELQYHSNCNSVFEFYFPILSHIFYFDPESVDELLYLLVGLIFAFGMDDEFEIVQQIRKNMVSHLKANPFYLTKNGKDWVGNILPIQEDKIKIEIKRCIKELNEE